MSMQDRSKREIIEHHKTGQAQLALADLRIAELEKRLALATEFHVAGSMEKSTAIFIKKCFGSRLPKEPMWKVQDSFDNVLPKDGLWEYEPRPSSRDADFYARCRYDTFDDALAAVNALKGIYTYSGA